jgi:hypothetical protein
MITGRHFRRNSLAAVRLVVSMFAVVTAFVTFFAGVQPAGAALTPPPVPGTNQPAYLGAWVMPNEYSTQQDHVEVSQLSAFEGTIGRPLAIVQLFQNWTQPVSLSALRAIAGTGAIPNVSWRCDVADPDSDSLVASGAEDNVIKTEADTLKEFGRPVFLRWFWEFNITNLPDVKDCLGGDSVTGPGAQTEGAGFAAAWIHIRQIFQQEGATNVAFVWNPSLSPFTSVVPPDQVSQDGFYPGSQYVDWIGGDCYDRVNTPTFKKCFDDNSQYFDGSPSWYTEFGSLGKPMMVGETGAPTLPQGTQSSQHDYLLGNASDPGVISDMPNTYPNIRAFLYLDSLKWVLQGNGLRAFRTLANTCYFMAMPNGPPPCATNTAAAPSNTASKQTSLKRSVRPSK